MKMKSGIRNLANVVLAVAALAGLTAGIVTIERAAAATPASGVISTPAPGAMSTPAPAAAAMPASAAALAASGAVAVIATIPGMPPVVDPRNLYSEVAAGRYADAVKNDLTRIYVPNLRSNDVYVVDPAAMKVVDRFKVGIGPQHIVPGWDLRTLWVTNNAEGRTDGSLTPIDPRTGKPGKAVMVDDPYNMYFCLLYTSPSPRDS